MVVVVMMVVSDGSGGDDIVMSENNGFPHLFNTCPRLYLPPPARPRPALQQASFRPINGASEA